MNSLSRRRDLLTIGILYTFSYWLIIVNTNFVYWDDWVLYKSNSSSIIEMFAQAGFPYVAYVHKFFLDYLGIFGYRIVTFLVFLLSSVFLYFVIEKIDFIDKIERFYIVLFFSILPLNNNRIAIINFIYSLSFFLFFGGFYSFASFLHKGGTWRRLLSLVAFFVSFITNSFLVFYFIVFVFCLIYVWKNRLNINFIRFTVVKYLDFWLIPFGFYVLKLKFFITSGLYENYNKINFHNFCSALWKSFYYSVTNFYNLFQHTFEQLSILTLILILFLSIFLIYALKDYGFFYEVKIERIFLFLIFGIIFCYLAIFPYSVVKKFFQDSFVDWQNRTQLLLPLGYSFIITSFLLILKKIFKSKKIVLVISCTLIAVFISKNNSYYFDYIKDGIKQDAIVIVFKNSSDVRNHSTFLFVDNAEDYNANGRYLRFYELTGLAYSAFGDQRRLIILEKYVNSNLKKIGLEQFISKFEGLDRVSLAEYKFYPATHIIKFNKISPQLHSNKEIFQLLLMSYVDRSKYEKLLQSMFSIDVQPLNS